MPDQALQKRRGALLRAVAIVVCAEGESGNNIAQRLGTSEGVA